MTSSAFETTATERIKKKMRGPTFATIESRRLRSRSIEVNFHAQSAFQNGSQLVEWLRKEQLQRQEMAHNAPPTTTTRTNAAAKSIYSSRPAHDEDDQDIVQNPSRKKMCVGRDSDCDGIKCHRRSAQLNLTSSEYDHVAFPTTPAGESPLNSVKKLSGVNDSRPQRAWCGQEDITAFSSTKTPPIETMQDQYGQEEGEETGDRLGMDEGIQSLLASVEKQAQARFKAKWNFDLESGEPDTAAIDPVCMWSVVRQ